MTSPIPPSKEDVTLAKRHLVQLAEDYATQKGSDYQIGKHISIILSALSIAESERVRYRNDAIAIAEHCDELNDKNASLCTRLESAERENERLRIENGRWVPHIRYRRKNEPSRHPWIPPFELRL